MTPDPGQAGGDPGGVAGPVALAAGPASSVWRHSRARAVPLRSRGARRAKPHSDLMAKAARPLAAHRTTPRRRRRARKNARTHTRSHAHALRFPCKMLMHFEESMRIVAKLNVVFDGNDSCQLHFFAHTHTHIHSHTHTLTRTHTQTGLSALRRFSNSRRLLRDIRVCFACIVTSHCAIFGVVDLRSCGDSVAFPRGAFCGAG